MIRESQVHVVTVRSRVKYRHMVLGGDVTRTLHPKAVTRKLLPKS